jgi:predicted secreted hydrolase
MKKAFVVVMILLLPLVLSVSVGSRVHQQKNGLPDEFIVEDITMRDGGHHKTQNPAVEWWYFDAVVNTNLSVHVGLMLLSQNNHGFVFPGINIYENGISLYHKRIISTFQSFSGSEEKPLIYFKNIPYINGTINEQTGHAEYQVNLSLGDASVSLHFNSTMRGWKCDEWAVIMPKATVTGNLMFNNQMLSVEGEGYHEHKWNLSTSFVSENRGYFWGRILSNTTSLVWSQMYPQFSQKRVLAVLNIGNDTYMKINESDFHFTILAYETKLPRITPIAFAVTIQNATIRYDVNISTLEYQRWQFFNKLYCRYNVDVHGFVNVTGKVDERIDIKSLMEHARFSFL